MLGSGLWRSGGRLILLPLLATLAVCAVVLAILSATFTANAAPSPAPAAPAPTARPAPPPGGPTFEVATASTDKPVMMADFVKADDASTSFGDMFVQALKTSPRVSDFASLEHDYSPRVAKARVKSGDSVLAVIVGTKFTQTFRHNMVSALRGGDVRPLPITVIAGPQALAEHKLILREYRQQALKPTLNYLADEMRIVVKKSGCDVPGTAPGRCVTVTDAMLDKFASPFRMAVRAVGGPAAKSFDYPSQQDHGAIRPDPAPTAPTTHVSPSSAPTMNTLGMLMVLIVVAGLLAATTTAWAVDHRLGLSVFTTGPWRRQNASMPFPRRKAVIVKNIAGVVVGAVASSLVVGIYLAGSGRLSGAALSAPTMQLGNTVLWAFAVLLVVAIVLFVQTLQAVIGTPGWLVAAVVVLGVGLPAAGIGALLAGEFSADGALVRAAGGLAGHGRIRGIVEAILPVGVTLLAVAVLSWLAGVVVSGVYDRYVTTAVRSSTQ